MIGIHLDLLLGAMSGKSQGNLQQIWRLLKDNLELSWLSE